ncbi:MAG TPA: VIT domain-containing protein [Vicinamibacterales bacterium]
MPDPATMPRGGLFTTGAEAEPVALTGVRVDAEIHRCYAKVVLAQRYVNTESNPIEAVYVFPLDEGAAICGFEAVIDDTLVVGEVLDREKAFEKYDDAMEAGHGAYLLDEERPDVFQASIGNLPPGKDVTVRLTYVTELGVESGHIRFVVPTTVSPRYAPVDDHRGVGRPDAETLNPPTALTVPYGLNFSARIAMPDGITAVESPSHPISVRMNGSEAVVSLGQRDAALDRDLVLEIEAPGLDAPHALVERDDDGTEAIGVSFAPVFPTVSAPAEILFLVDRSGSMGGTSIEEVRRALQLCLRSMIPGCRFNIVGFGSRYQSLFPESRLYDQGTLDEATKHVNNLDADLGGTEILEALQFVLETKRDAELPRQVIVLTDGQVTNTDAVLGLAAKHAATARIFTFGIGAGASHHLVAGLARAGKGTAEWIYPGERIEPKVLRQFARLLSPALTDVQVEWRSDAGANVDVKQSPLAIPPIFAGGRLLLYAFAGGERPSQARLTAIGPSGRVSFDVSVPAARSAGRTVSTLAARARIRELEESGEYLSARGSRQRGRREDRVKQEIIALSLKYGLMSRETSFVAVERRETPVEGDVKLRKVPVALPTGWGGKRRQAFAYAQRLYSLDAFDGPPIMAARSAVSSPVPERATRMREGMGTYEEASGVDLSWLMPRLSRRSRPSRTQALIVLQTAEGFWNLESELASIIGRDLDDLRSAIKDVAGAETLAARAWATALALVWLELNAHDTRDEWRMLADKARRWLDRAAILPPDGADWLDSASRFITR